MKKSISYHITMFIVKLKGLKSIFSKDPIDYLKLRKGDIHTPKSKFFKKDNTQTFQILKTTITAVKPNEDTNKLILFIHGGAFISGPSQIHWDSIQKISQQTNQTVWMCDYPKAPEHKIEEISNNIDFVYAKALESFKSSNISLIGDSVGGTLITSLVQRLVKHQLDLPHQIILVSPVMDASMTNPAIDQIDTMDPMLAKVGLMSAKRMCAADVTNELISPINGNFDNFPRTTLFIAENDITYPDQVLAAEKLKKANTHLEVIIGEEMPHIWPYLPIIKESKIALQQIVAILTN